MSLVESQVNKVLLDVSNEGTHYCPSACDLSVGLYWGITVVGGANEQAVCLSQDCSNFHLLPQVSTMDTEMIPKFSSKDEEIDYWKCLSLKYKKR